MRLLGKVIPAGMGFMIDSLATARGSSHRQPKDSELSYVIMESVLMMATQKADLNRAKSEQAIID